MNLEVIREELEINGRLSRKSIGLLRQMILSDNPFSAISLATDCALFSLAPEIAKCVNHETEIVRWMATSALLNRFRLVDHVDIGIYQAQYDPSTVVQGTAFTGIGEVLPDVKDKNKSRLIAELLLKEFEDDHACNRRDAYFGILSAMDILLTDQPSASKNLDYSRDINWQIIESFKEQYMLPT